MKKKYRQAVATILEAINNLRWILNKIEWNTRKLKDCPETQTFTAVRIFHKSIDEWVPADINEKYQRRYMEETMCQEIAKYLLQRGAIRIETTETERSLHGIVHAVECRATVRVVIPEKEVQRNG